MPLDQQATLDKGTLFLLLIVVKVNTNSCTFCDK